MNGYNGYTILGIALAAVGFILWLLSYLFFRKRIRPLQLENRRETDPSLTPAQKKLLRFYNTLLAIACILAVSGCLITLIVRFL